MCIQEIVCSYVSTDKKADVPHLQKSKIWSKYVQRSHRNPSPNHTMLKGKFQNAEELKFSKVVIHKKGIIWCVA